jgi:hypothetical protein
MIARLARLIVAACWRRGSMPANACAQHAIVTAATFS